MELKMMFYLSNVAIAVNISQPSVRIGGGLHALIHIFVLHGGLKAPNRIGTLIVELRDDFISWGPQDEIFNVTINVGK